MDVLNEKQRRFAAEYVVDNNATQAAERAGYSKKTARQQGSRLLSNAYVQDAIAEERKALMKRVHVDQEYVVNGLVENLERSMQQVPVLDKEGKETGEYQYAGNVANGALKMLGQNLGMFNEKITLDLGQGALDALMAGRARAARSTS